MPDEAKELWKYAPVVLLLLLAIWAGHRGFWYWGANTREVIRRIEHERDDWRNLALLLLRKQGISLPADLSSTDVRTYTDQIKKG